MAIWREVTPGAILTKCGLWGDMVDLITYAIFGDCRLSGLGVVRVVNLPFPIDLRCRPYNTGHATVWPCEESLKAIGYGTIRKLGYRFLFTFYSLPALSCIVLEIKRDIGRKYDFFHTFLAFNAPVRSVSVLEYHHTVRCGNYYPMVKNFDDQPFRQNTGACDRRTHRRTDSLPRHSPRYAYASRDKNPVVDDRKGIRLSKSFSKSPYD